MTEMLAHCSSENTTILIGSGDTLTDFSNFYAWLKHYDKTLWLMFVEKKHYSMFNVIPNFGDTPITNLRELRTCIETYRDDIKLFCEL